MKNYQHFTQELDDFSKKIEFGNSIEEEDKVLLYEYLNGRASKELEKRISPQTIAKHGIYFTPPELAQITTKPLLKNLNFAGIKIFDPTCGVADLLLQFCNKLPFSNDLTKTLNFWGESLMGFDLHQELIDVAKWRLVLKAISLGAKLRQNEKLDFNNLFPRLVKQDIRFWKGKISPNTIVVMNPPFNQHTISKNITWSTGKTSYAAYFLDIVLKKSVPDTIIAAILPDVLRSGTRYHNWRDEVQNVMSIHDIDIFGLFSLSTDVDVFILRGIALKKQKKTTAYFYKRNNELKTIGQISRVNIGQVVPFRLTGKGNWMPYLTAKDFKTSEIVSSINKRIRFVGSGIKPPFVAIKRTSNPKDHLRIIPCIVKGNKNIAVENHIIIIKPLDGTIRTCKKIVSNLLNEQTKVWMNNRIRCRHLTALSIKELPIWESK